MKNNTKVSGHLTSDGKGKSPTSKPSAKKKSRKSASKTKSPQTSGSTPSADVENQSKPPVKDKGFAVVAIGASAGGLMAFNQFFNAMPADSGMAFVLVQHLEPTHKSLIAELLRSQTQMTVLQIETKMRIEPNHVYVIPPGKYLTVEDRTFHLNIPTERRGIRVPIDVFFRSLAQNEAQRGIAVVMTGNGSDGTLGAREIKAAGGIVVVQTPKTCQYDGMPQSVISAGLADVVLPITDMPSVLLRYVQHGYVNGVSLAETSDEKPDGLTAILGLLHSREKMDFSSYKKGTITRRIQRRMSLRHIENLAAYLKILRGNEDECKALAKDLLIGVTSFFREPEAWEELVKRVIEAMASDPTSELPLRVWVAGCASGEEAYTLAMLLVEACHKAESGRTINVFASDLDSSALAYARAGVYPESIAEQVSVERLQRFFVRGDHVYRIKNDIRDVVVFAEQNIISDPPFSKMDIITCRNLLIYLEPSMQKRYSPSFISPCARVAI